MTERRSGFLQALEWVKRGDISGCARRAKALLKGYIDASDEFTRWLGFANAGMQHPGNLHSFSYAIENLPSGDAILEIGSFCGLSTNLICYYKALHGRSNPFFTCDEWVFESAQPEEAVGRSDVSHADYRSFVKETFTRNVRFFSGKSLPFAIETNADAFFASWSQNAHTYDVFGREVQLGGPIAFAFIDGNHAYDFVRRDFNNCDQFLVPGGFILFDDSEDQVAGDVWRLCQEVARSGRYDVAAKNPHYLLRRRLRALSG